MSRTPRRSMPLRAATLAATGLLVAGLAGPALAAKPSSAGPAPTATEIRFDSVSTPSITVPSTPGAPTSYIVQDTAFVVSLSFWGLDGAGDMAPLPLSENKATGVTVTGPGLSATVDVPAGALETELTGLVLPDPAEAVTLRASAPGPRKTEVTGESDEFDVLIQSKPVTGRTTIGGAGGTAEECVATPAEPVCGDLLPPPIGGFGPHGLLANGVCAVSDTACKATYIQALVGIPDATETNPATLIMKCDKTLCGVGAIKSSTLSFQLTPTGDRVVAPACPAKGTVGSYDAERDISETNAPFCVDYVQSTRDNAGDTLLYLLFYVDAKVRWM